jgi:hypothetical protein
MIQKKGKSGILHIKFISTNVGFWANFVSKEGLNNQKVANPPTNHLIFPSFFGGMEIRSLPFYYENIWQ